MTTTNRSRTAASTTFHRRGRGGAVVAAVLTPLLVWSVAVPGLGINLTVEPGSDTRAALTVGPVLVAAVSLLAGLLGWALLAVLEGRTQRAHAVWGGTASVVLLLSLAGPVTRATTTSAAITLIVMHVGVAAVLIPLLVRTSVSPHA